MDKQVLIVKNLNKQFKRKSAVSSLSFTVNKGDVYGILGPNGSGKTTTMRIILGLLEADGGEHHWNFDVTSSKKTVLSRIGVLSESPGFYPFLSAEDNLKIFSLIRNAPSQRIHELLAFVKLSEHRKKKFAEMSLGMKQRLALAVALIGNPEVLVFDEPTNGLDASGIVAIRTLIRELSEQGDRTIMIASHLLGEIEKVCNRILLIKDGKKVVEGEVAMLLNTGDPESPNQRLEDFYLKNISGQ